MESETLALVLLPLKLPIPPLEMGRATNSTNKIPGKRENRLYLAREFLKPASGNYELASVNTSCFPRKL
jgi:hypothetical protein